MPGNASENKGLAKVIPARSEAGLEYLWLPYAQMKTAPFPLVVKATHGCRIVLADGRELIDGIASWWTACHGYNHPHIRAAVERQLQTMPHVMLGGLVHEQALTLAQRLAGLLGPGNLDRVFFSESGSVAVEVALKMALQYWCNRGIFGRERIVAFRGGYHGDTSGAMAISDPESGFHGTLSGALPQQIIIDPPVDEASDLERWDEPGDHVSCPQLAGQLRDPVMSLRIEHQHSGPGKEAHQAVQVAEALHDVSFQVDQDHRAGQAEQCLIQVGRRTGLDPVNRPPLDPGPELSGPGAQTLVEDDSRSRQE